MEKGLFWTQDSDDILLNNQMMSYKELSLLLNRSVFAIRARKSALKYKIENENNYSVYIHINKINNKKYIGITSQKPEKRWSNGNGYKKGHFKSAIDKYGWNNFDHKILHNNLTKEEAKSLEVELIAKYNTMNTKFGYNKTLGGEGMSGYKSTLEAIEKNRISHSGEKGFNYGKKLSEETRRKIGDANSVKVVQMQINGDYICTYKSIANAEKALNVSSGNIVKCCSGKIHSAYGFLWCYNDDYCQEWVQKILNKHSNSLCTNKRIVQLSNNGDYITTFKSISEAGKCLKVNSSRISRVCKKEEGENIAIGYKWRYEIDYLNKTY